MKALHLYHPPEASTTRLINSKLNREYESYTTFDYSLQIINSSDYFGSIDKYSDGNTQFELNIDKETFKNALINARTIFENILMNTRKKHEFNSEDEYNKMVYYNLCEQHDCDTHE